VCQCYEYTLSLSWLFIESEHLLNGVGLDRVCVCVCVCACVHACVCVHMEVFFYVLFVHLCVYTFLCMQAMHVGGM